MSDDNHETPAEAFWRIGTEAAASEMFAPDGEPVTGAVREGTAGPVSRGKSLRDQIIEKLAVEAESFPEELYVFEPDRKWHQINAGQQVALWLRSKQREEF
jgi:hypothetical protein